MRIWQGTGVSYFWNYFLPMSERDTKSTLIHNLWAGANHAMKGKVICFYQGNIHKYQRRANYFPNNWKLIENMRAIWCLARGIIKLMALERVHWLYGVVHKPDLTKILQQSLQQAIFSASLLSGIINTSCSYFLNWKLPFYAGFM